MSSMCGHTIARRRYWTPPRWTRRASNGTSPHWRAEMTESDTMQGTDGPAADVFVIFGITGDLARVMTFHSLYRLEERGLLTCPILGAAVDDWSGDQLREHAREAVEATGQAVDKEIFERFAERLS